MSIVLLKLLLINPLHGHSILNLDVRAKYGLNIVAIRRNHEIIVSPQAIEMIYRKGHFNCYWMRM